MLPSVMGAVFAFVLAVVFVFLVLAAQYKSLTLPLAVMLIVPMSLIASITGVLLCGQDNNIFTQVGFIVLIGLAAKNAILIVEFAKQLKDRRRDRLGCGSGSRSAATAADLDNVARLHFRRRAAGVGDGGWRRAQSDTWYRGFCRHDRRHGVRIDLHAGLLRYVPVARYPRPEGDNQRGSPVGAGRMSYEVCPPKAKVTSSNLVGRANLIKDLCKIDLKRPTTKLTINSPTK